MAKGRRVIKKVSLPKQSSFFWLTFGLGGIFVFVVHHRILAYVCGNDPMLYIRAARTLLSPEFYGSEALRESLTFVAPGFPVLLAAGMFVFGDLAPYWLNLFIILGTIPLWFSVFKQLMKSRRAACFSVLGFLWVLLQGHSLHAPFMFYPFREASRLFFVTLCFWLFLKGFNSETSWKRRMLSSSVCLIVACSIREPSIFVLPGMLLGAFFLPAARTNRWKTIGVFLIPLGVLAVVALVLVSQGYLGDFSQFSVVRYLRNHETALDRMDQMRMWFPERAGGWVGLSFVVLGMIRAGWKSRVLLCWYGLTAFLIFAFYAYVHMHDRYFMTTLIFLLPFAGYGVEGIIRAVEEVLPAGTYAQRIPKALNGLVLAGIVLGMVRTAEDVEVWGPGAGAEQVRKWQHLVSELEPGADGRVHIAVEQRCRYLEDMLLSYTDANLLDPKETENWSDQVFPAHYFKPINKAAFYETPQWLMYKEVIAHRQIEHVFNLLPVEYAEVMRIGEGEYSQMRISPFRAGRTSQVVDVKVGVDQFLWLNWGNAEEDDVRYLHLHRLGNENPILSFESKGRGLQILPVPSDRIGKADQLELRVVSQSPGPHRPVIDVSMSGEPYSLELGSNRIVSTNDLFPKRKFLEMFPGYIVLHDNRIVQFRVPNVLGDQPVVTTFTPVFRNLQESSEPLTLRFSSAGKEEEAIEIKDVSVPITFPVSSGELYSLTLSTDQDYRLGLPAIQLSLELSTQVVR